MSVSDGVLPNSTQPHRRRTFDSPLADGRGEFLNSLSSVRTTMTFRSDGKATLRSPFTVDTDDLFDGKAFDALDQLLAAPKHDKFRRI